MGIYIGIGKQLGNDIPAEQAFDYAADACGLIDFDETAPNFEEFAKAFVDWFFDCEWYLDSEGYDGEI